jgi:hypothetical protein
LDTSRINRSLWLEYPVSGEKSHPHGRSDRRGRVRPRQLPQLLHTQEVPYLQAPLQPSGSAASSFSALASGLCSVEVPTMLRSSLRAALSNGRGMGKPRGSLPNNQSTKSNQLGKRALSPGGIPPPTRVWPVEVEEASAVSIQAVLNACCKCKSTSPYHVPLGLCGK